MRFGCRMDYPEGDLAEMPEVHWSEWLGPAKERFYSDYFRCEWYGWFDFATGSLGGWGTHILDAVFFALKLKYPDERGTRRDVAVERRPISAARHDPVRLSARERRLAAAQGLLVRRQRAESEEPASQHPPLSAAVSRDPEEIWRSRQGVGQRGQHFCRRQGDDFLLFPRRPAAIVPLGTAARVQAADPTLPRPCGDIFRDFFRACKEGGHPAFSNFADFSGPFVEGLLAGHLAVHAGLNQRVEWDGEKMQCPNHPELNRWVKQERRKGWELV